MKINIVCTLCGVKQCKEFFYKKKHKQTYYQCQNCFLIFLESKEYLSSEDEKKHYEKHENNVEDEDYQKFVLPIVDAVKKDFSSNSRGLDFGCGEGPVISYQLKKDNYNMTLYDPYFKNDLEALNKTYDFIVVCEVIEHFYKPMDEFVNLKALLREGGRLYLMTGITDLVKDFPSWHYHRDPTHVSLFSVKTFEYISKKIGLDLISCDKKKLTVFEKKE